MFNFHFSNSTSSVTRPARLALLALVLVSGGPALAQRADDRVDQAQRAVTERIISQDTARGVTVRYADDSRTEFPSNEDVRVRGTGTAVRDDNGASRAFSYEAMVNTRTRSVSGVKYDWRSDWSRADTRRRPADRLTGTYQLDTSRSDNAATTATRVTQNLPARQQQRLRNAVMSRLETPDTLTLERTGRTITMASSRAEPVTFDADGSEQVEQSRNGRQVRTTATTSGDRLVITTEGDRSIDYQVTFESIDNGRALRVTRRITAEDLERPVVARSVYSRTSGTARTDVYAGERARSTSRDNSTRRSEMPDGTIVVAALNGDLSTQQARTEDTFTLTVRSPSQYAGQTITGTIGSVERSGRVSGRAGMSFLFETIQTRDGRTSPFTGAVESVRTAAGDDIRVDTEGQVQDGSQTGRTVTRTGVGAAIGAVIGAVTGGAQGAAIGAGVGAGAGAGSVVAQGPNDLDLKNGTEFTIRSIGQR
jgi:hypothetical protein